MDVTLYMTVADAAAELGLSRPRIWQFIKAGKLTIRHTLGRVPLLSRSEVVAYKPKVQGKAGRPPKPSAPRTRKRGGKGT